MSLVVFRRVWSFSLLCAVAGVTLSACGGDGSDVPAVVEQEKAVPQEQEVVADTVAASDEPGAPPDPVYPQSPEPPEAAEPPPAPNPPEPPPEPPAPADASLAIRNLATGENLCLAISTSNGTYVGFQSCSGADAQRWRMVRTPSGYFQVRNVLAESQGRDVCLRAAPSNPGTVNMWPCDGTDYPTTRLWQADFDADGSFAMRNKHWSDIGKRVSLQSTDGTLAMLPAVEQPAARWTYDGDVPSPVRIVTGDRRVLLMSAHFTDQTANPAEPIRKAVFGDGANFGSLAHYVGLASRGKLTLGGTMLTDVDLGAFPAGCNSGAILDQARAAARVRGVDPGAFDYLFVDFPRSSECKFAGLAARPGQWILSNGSGHAYWMWAHEFGHGLGAGHPDSLRNCPIEGGAVMLGADCVTGGIDDPADTLGGGGRRMYPVDYQLFAGWLDEADVPLLVTPGTYRLAPLWSALPGKQGYRLPRGDGSYLLLEFRRPWGAKGTYEDWPDTSPFVNGVAVRIVRYPGRSIQNTLVDATPDSNDGMKDAPLMPGKSLVDTVSGRRITVLSADDGGAVVQVETVR
ncbi:carbohydrate-binding protein [Burkholderia multivorans]|uniref:RICIN domain-containing protein n=1 Tax=Burkholderia ubonensis TaxID=101571 RepID=UPI000F6D200F|nr:RICIN domain-containing protein [Burkholderia ubonensis]AYZ67842.1 carbohydrate-binding protein [Burkholderia multivorans]VWC15695.1 carbohydrate-binding protein [Burkholderia ubonensis]